MKKLIISLICTISLLTAAVTANAAKMGVAVDQGFGVTGQFGNINAFVGNDGISGDYIFKQGSFTKQVPFQYYIAGGAFIDWDDDHYGVRVPLGLTFPFTTKWQAFGQVSPKLSYRDKPDDFKFAVSAALGLRYAF